jgi:hypothetical protein
MIVTRRSLLKALLAGAAVAALSSALPLPALAAPPSVAVWKAASCGCCEGWVKHMRAAGFPVQVTEMDDLSPVKARQGVPSALQSCHTAIVDGYVLEGHVPAPAVLRLLAERPRARGLAVPGMPLSAPGMDAGADRYDVVLFGLADGGTRIFERY